MSELDHITDDNWESKEIKIQMLLGELELCKAQNEVLLGRLGCDRPSYDTLKTEARELMKVQREREQIEQRPPRMEPMDD